MNRNKIMTRVLLAVIAPVVIALPLLTGCTPKSDAPVTGTVTGRWAYTQTNHVRTYHLRILTGSGQKRVVRVRPTTYRRCRPGSPWPACSGGKS